MILPVSVRSLVAVGAALTCLACASPAERKAEAEADLAEQRAKAARDYRDCVEKHRGKDDVDTACASYRSVAETLAK